jgi:hypothetical protein
LLLLGEEQLPVGDDVELTLLARDGLGLVSGGLVQLGRETRGPAVIAVSDGAVEDLDLHVSSLLKTRRAGPDRLESDVMGAAKAGVELWNACPVHHDVECGPRWACP